jgi:hypothetical protein
MRTKIERLTWFIPIVEPNLYITGFISIDICWLEIFDVSQEEVTWWWWWCVSSVVTIVSIGEDDKTMTAVDFVDWSQAGILNRLTGGNEIFNWSSKRIFVGRLYLWV